jgi:hypothetical protein
MLVIEWCRGDEIKAQVTISDSEKAGSVEVGVVCTEHYDEDVTEETIDDHGIMQEETHRKTLHATAHEDWRPIERFFACQTGSPSRNS